MSKIELPPCEACGGSGIEGVDVVAACCGHALPSGECCGNAIPEEVPQQCQRCARDRQIVEVCARLCEQNAVETPLRGKKRLAAAASHDASEAMHDGQVYAAAIRSLLSASALPGTSNAPPGIPPSGSQTDGGGVAVGAPMHSPEKPQLVGYDECRCILTQYCDGTCRPVFAMPTVLERAKTLYANSPCAYRGTRPLPWNEAPMPTRQEFIAKAKAEAAAASGDEDSSGGKSAALRVAGAAGPLGDPDVLAASPDVPLGGEQG